MGENLQRFHTMAKNIAELSSKIAMQLSNKTMQAELSELQYIFNRTLELDEHSRSGAESLKAMLAGLEIMQNHINAFSRITRNLHVLCRLIRIESARFDLTGHEFTALGEDVHKLTQDVEAGSSHLRDHSRALTLMIQENHSRVSLFRGGQQTNARFILDHAVVNVTSLEEKNRLSSQILSEATDRWKQISEDIGEIVSSLQFHDITRQRIEHVAAFLRHTAQGQQKSAEQNGPHQQAKMDPAFILQACSLQKSQLLNAGEEMEEAGNRMIQSVLQISKSIAEIAAQTLRINEGGKLAESSFVAGLEKSLVHLTKIISEYESANHEILTTLEYVSEKVKVLASFIGEIEHLGIEIRKVALNACIHSANAGDSGLALGVLAGFIHELSTETDTQIHLIARELQAIVSVADELSAGAHNGYKDDRKGAKQMAARMERMVELCCSMNADISSLMQSIESETEIMITELNASVSDLNAHRKMSHEIRNACEQLQKIASEIGSDDPLPGEETRGNRALEVQASSYTMERERDIHQSFLKSTGDLLTSSDKAVCCEPDEKHQFLKEENESELGNNVELF